MPNDFWICAEYNRRQGGGLSTHSRTEAVEEEEKKSIYTYIYIGRREREDNIMLYTRIDFPSRASLALVYFYTRRVAH